VEGENKQESKIILLEWGIPLGSGNSSSGRGNFTKGV